MRQAIEEGFILDVLKNYTPYKLAFKLAHNGKELDEKEVERSEALKGIMRWVRLHPYNIAQKVQVVVEHFRENVAPLLAGKAKAMVVVASRLEAVRWQLAIDKYIKDQGYQIATLVAFSGEINDPQSGPDPFTETSQDAEPEPAGPRYARGVQHRRVPDPARRQQVSDRLRSAACFAECMSTSGWPALRPCRRFRGSIAPIDGKDTTYVLDFVNDPDEILAAFKTYYATAELANVTDPHLVYDLRMKLDAAGFYDDFEVNRVVEVELNPKAKQSDLAAALEPVVGRLLQRYKNAQESLKIANAKSDAKAAADAQNELNALAAVQA